MGLMAFGASRMGVPFDADMVPIADLPAQLLMVHAWGFAPGLGWNAPSWSISAEWFAYLAFPAYLMIAIALKNRPWMLLSLATGLFFALDLIHQSFFGETLPMATETYGVIRIIPEFLIGVGLYRLGQANQLSKVAARAGFWIVLLAYLAGAHMAWDDRILALLGAPLIFLLAEMDRSAPPRTGRDSLRYLGDTSYVIYMIHVPFFMISFNVLQDVFGVIDDTISTAIILGLLGGLLLASSLTYEILEKPSRNVIRKFAGRLFGGENQKSGEKIQ